MAITIPIVTEFADKGLKSAEAAFTNFKSKVSEAEGGMGKMKAGFSAATDFMKANAATFAASAGAALAGFALKGVAAFQELALEASNFSDATGLAVEDASRWIEVAGDIGIEAATVKTSLNKLNKEISNNRDYFKELGIEIATTNTGATDVNQTFLNVVDKLKGIKDPADRARIATELLGKGWTNMAELIEMGSGQLKRSLDSVSDAKVIDEKEVQKAKDYRAAQDALKDAIEDLSLAIGEELIPYLTDGAEKLAALADKAWIVGDTIGFLSNPVKQLGDWWNQITGNSEDADTAITHFNDALGLNRKAMNDARYEARKLADQMGGLDRNTNNLIDTWDILLVTLDRTDALNHVKDSLDNVYEAAGRALEEKTPEAARAAQDAVNALYGDVADYIQLLGDIPADKQTRILAALDEGRYADVMRMLNELTRERTVKINTVGGTTVRPGDTPSESRGVTVRAPDGTTHYLPPGIDFGALARGNTARPLDLTSGGGSGNRPTVMVNVQGSVTSEKDLVETIRRGLVNAQRNGAQLVYSNT